MTSVRVTTDLNVVPQKIVRIEAHDEDGNVQILGYDDEGSTWYLACIAEDGIRLHSGIDSTLGLAVDKRGCLKVTRG